MSILQRLMKLISPQIRRQMFEGEEPIFVTRKFTWSGFEQGQMLAMRPDWQLWVEFYDSDSGPRWHWDANRRSTRQAFNGGVESSGYPSLIEAIDACERWFDKHATWNTNGGVGVGDWVSIKPGFYNWSRIHNPRSVIFPYHDRTIGQVDSLFMSRGELWIVIHCDYGHTPTPYRFVERI